MLAHASAMPLLDPYHTCTHTRREHTCTHTRREHTCTHTNTTPKPLTRCTMHNATPNQNKLRNEIASLAGDSDVPGLRCGRLALRVVRRVGRRPSGEVCAVAINNRMTYIILQLYMHHITYTTTLHTHPKLSLRFDNEVLPVRLRGR